MALSGTGLNQPGISVTTPQGGTALPFGPVLNDGAGNHVGTQAFTIQNLGLQPLVISQNGLTLTNATGFAIQGITSSTQGTINLATGSKTVAANSAETWTVTVNLDPTGNAAYSGTLSVASNDPVTPSAALTLNGSGTTPTLTLNPATSTTPVLNIQAGQIYNITWSAGDTSDTAAAATLTLATAPTNAMPATGLTTIATIPFNPATTSYAWRPGASLVGQQVYVYGSLADTGVAANSFSAQKVQVEAAGSFSLLSPLVTAGTNYVYQYLYNGKVYAGTAALQAGNNLVSISTPMNGGGSVVHQISVTSTPSLLATQGYTYDEMNRVKTFTNGNGITTTNTYDFRGNLTQSSASNGNVVAYAYDALNRRTSMTDGTGTTFYDYDDMDRVTGITYSGDAIKGNSDDLLLSYGYDNASRVTSITYPGGQQVAYTFDNAGRMLTAKDVANNLTTTYFYNPTSGLLQTVTRPNGVLTTYGYNSAGLLNDIKHTKGSSTLAEYAYSLDSRGNATALLTTFSDGSKKQELYTYDGQQRLTQVVYGHNATAAVNQDKTVDYTYDGVGNRLTQKTTIGNAVTQTLTCSYGSENRLVQITDQTGAVVNSYVYDAAGNRIQKVTPAGATYYSYDERNLLTSVVTPADYITYTYNGAAQRVGKTVNGVTTKYIVDPSRSVFQNVQEWSGGAITKSYVYGDDRLECNPASASLQFYLPDRLGSVRIITDQNGNVTSTYNYDAFGAQQ